tara:strand:+ start:55 stop:534 length:480 start_codon:yes stop_codon:yes gene_type:complete
MKANKRILVFLTKASNIAIREIVKTLSQSKDPLVKMIAMRRWKNGYGIPPSMLKISKEFLLLGKIYNKKTSRSIKHLKSEYRLRLTRNQKAEIHMLLRKASLWVYKHWSSVITARLMVRYGGRKTISNLAFDLLRFKHLRFNLALEYRRLLLLFSETLP